MNHLSLNSYNLGCPSEPSPRSLCASEVIRDRTKSYKQPREIIIINNYQYYTWVMIYGFHWIWFHSYSCLVTQLQTQDWCTFLSTRVVSNICSKSMHKTLSSIHWGALQTNQNCGYFACILTKMYVCVCVRGCTRVWVHLYSQIRNSKLKKDDQWR